MGDPDELGLLVHRADAAALLRHVDATCARRDWAHLLTVRDRCQAAAEELGKQLWPIAHYAEYRIALEAPGELAGSVLWPGAARFALGPLTEVAAQHHRWEELAEHLALPAIAATVAQERVLRGEDLRGDARAHPDELELPLVLLPWEPAYPLPTYRTDELLENGPAPPREPRGAAGRAAGPAPGADPDPETDPGTDPGTDPAAAGLERALRVGVSAWADESNGHADVATLAGPATRAVAALVPGGASLIPLGPAEALERLAWAAASGGAYGRRRGMAAGRSHAFWVARVATGVSRGAGTDELARALERLEWYEFGDPSGGIGWRLRLAIGDPATGRTTVVDAADARLEDEHDHA